MARRKTKKEKERAEEIRLEIVELCETIPEFNSTLGGKIIGKSPEWFRAKKTGKNYAYFTETEYQKIKDYFNIKD